MLNEAIDIVGEITVLREKIWRKIQTLGKGASAKRRIGITKELYGQAVVNVAVVPEMDWFYSSGRTKQLLTALSRAESLSPKIRTKSMVNLRIFMTNMSVLFSDGEK